MEHCADVEDLVTDFYGRMRAADSAGLEELLAGGEASLLIGTDPQEWWSGSDAITRAYQSQLDATGGFPIEAASPEAWSEGSVACFADRPVFRFPDKSVDLRITGVAVRQGEVWPIVQCHVSIGESNEETLGHDLPV
jgi:hypothetical protein